MDCGKEFSFSDIPVNKNEVRYPRVSDEPSSSLSTSDMSGDSGVDIKVSQLRTDLERVSKENKTLKAQLRGVSTMPTLLKDSVKQKDALMRKNNEQENVISRLQNRLFQLGASTSLTLEEDEIFYPSMTKENCDSLANEICRLKGELQNARVSPEEVTRLKQEYAEMKQELHVTRSRNQHLTEEITNMKSAMRSNHDEKDSMILQLKSELETFSQTSSIQESMNQSLCEERENLQQQLQQTSEVCRDMAKKLDDYKRQEGKHLTQEDKNKLLVDNEQLKLQLNEVILMNTRWQTYNEEQNVKIQRLNETIVELEEKVHQAEINPGYSEEQQKQIDRLLLQAKQRIEEEREQKEKVEADNRALEMALKQEEDEKKRLQTLMETGGGIESRPQDKEHIEFLKAQIQSCTEDFELERQDREKAQEKIAGLENENKYLKDRLAFAQQREEPQPYWQRRQESLNRYQQDYHQAQGYNLVARGVGGRDVADAFANDLQIDGPAGNHDNDGEGFDEIDACMVPPPPTNQKTDNSKSDSSRKVSEEQLECPRCSRGYPADKHQEFMEHVDLCCD